MPRHLSSPSKSLLILVPFHPMVLSTYHTSDGSDEVPSCTLQITDHLYAPSVRLCMARFMLISCANRCPTLLATIRIVQLVYTTVKKLSSPNFLDFQLEIFQLTYLVLHAIYITVFCVHSADQHVVADVIEVSPELQPRSGHRDVVRSALPQSLCDQTRAVSPDKAKSEESLAASFTYPQREKYHQVNYLLIPLG